jgi:Fur family transcriptional regulator, ferric uptake regulator
LQIDPKSDIMRSNDKNWVMSMSFYTADSLKAELHERGWRLTPQREVILDIFQNLAAGKHLSAEDLYELLKSEGHDISLSTIYRTVKLMARMGILRELELAEDHKHYEINQPYHHHHHLICVRCNQTIEFKNESVLKIGDKTSKKEGYHLLDCQLTIHAVCPSCQRAILPV